MQAAYLVKKGRSDKSFEWREIEIPNVKANEVLIKVSAFGLNYADVMARLGLYPDMPPLPCVLGYDVCGEVAVVGEDVTKFKQGDYVVALTRFGGYAEYAITDERACIVIDKDITAYKKLAMATQLSTSYCATIESINLREGDTILVHAAAGGVGLGIVQIALWKKCKIIAIGGSDEKLTFLKSLGVEYTINYKKDDIYEKIRDFGLHRKIDFVLDSVAGGKNIKYGFIPITYIQNADLIDSIKSSIDSLDTIGVKNTIENQIYNTILDNPLYLRYVGPPIKPTRYKLQDDSGKWGEWVNV